MDICHFIKLCSELSFFNICHANLSSSSRLVMTLSQPERHHRTHQITLLARSHWKKETHPHPPISHCQLGNQSLLQSYKSQMLVRRKKSYLLQLLNVILNHAVRPFLDQDCLFPQSCPSLHLQVIT